MNLNGFVNVNRALVTGVKHELIDNYWYKNEIILLPGDVIHGHLLSDVNAVQVVTKPQNFTVESDIHQFNWYRVKLLLKIIVLKDHIDIS